MPALRRRAQPLEDTVRALHRGIVHPIGITAAAASLRAGRRQLGFDIAAHGVEAEYGGIDALEFRRINVEPVKVAIEDERLGAALAVVSLEQGIEGERVAIQPARHP